MKDWLYYLAYLLIGLPGMIKFYFVARHIWRGEEVAYNLFALIAPFVLILAVGLLSNWSEWKDAYWLYRFEREQERRRRHGI